MFYIERWGGQITEVREKPLSLAQDALAKLKLMLTRWHLPGGYAFKLVASEGRGEYASHQVIFPDFKASAQPEFTSPKCLAHGGNRLLEWTPAAYSFTDPDRLTFTVPELGRWGCFTRDDAGKKVPSGHTGKVYMEDFRRYVQVGDQFRQHLQEVYGQFTVRHGRIMAKVG